MGEERRKKRGDQWFCDVSGWAAMGGRGVLCTCADEGLGLGSGRQRGSANGPGGQVGPVHSVLLAVEGDAHHDGALETPPQ